jgi:chorismate dehydratase
MVDSTAADSVVRVGAVGYLNARPLVFGLDRSPRFSLRFDVPAECAELLHAGRIDLGLIPSIEYLHGDYRIVPDLAIASRGPVRSVMVFTTRPMRDVRSIALDTSSRTSVALCRVLCARLFDIHPTLRPHSPDLASMLSACDAALIIGDKALFAEQAGQSGMPDMASVEKVDLGEAWTSLTGLPFVYAFWAGRAGSVTSDHIAELQQARDQGVQRPEELAREYLGPSSGVETEAIGAAYLRDNIKYHLGAEELAGLRQFYRYAREAALVDGAIDARFF